MTKYIIYFDGASKGNPGKSSYGFVIYRNRMVDSVEYEDIIPYYSSSGYLGVATNNFAEYSGLLEAIKFVNSVAIENETHLEIKGDSLLVINQVRGIWMTREPSLKLINTEILGYLNKYNSVKLEHIDRSKNTEADTLCNEVFKRLKTK